MGLGAGGWVGGVGCGMVGQAGAWWGYVVYGGAGRVWWGRAEYRGVWRGRVGYCGTGWSVYGGVGEYGVAGWSEARPVWSGLGVLWLCWGFFCASRGDGGPVSPLFKLHRIVVPHPFTFYFYKMLFFLLRYLLPSQSLHLLTIQSKHSLAFIWAAASGHR